jgi:hypothetical protein
METIATFQWRGQRSKCSARSAVRSTGQSANNLQSVIQISAPTQYVHGCVADRIQFIPTKVGRVEEVGQSSGSATAGSSTVPGAGRLDPPTPGLESCPAVSPIGFTRRSPRQEFLTDEGQFIPRRSLERDPLPDAEGFPINEKTSCPRSFLMAKSSPQQKSFYFMR